MNPGFLLAADIDGTLLGHEESERRFCQAAEAWAGHSRIVYVTGRSVDSVKDLVELSRLPRPDAIAGAVGTMLWSPHSNFQAEYEASVPHAWSAPEILRLGPGPGMELQPLADISRYKVSFFWDGEADSLEGLKRRLAGLSGWRILITAGRYLDVLPPNLGKGAAVDFLRLKFGYSKDQVLVAGDAGNDADMFGMGFYGVLPLESRDELRRVVPEGPRVLYSRQPCAAAVLEALSHFQLIG